MAATVCARYPRRCLDCGLQFGLRRMPDPRDRCLRCRSVRLDIDRTRRINRNHIRKLIRDYRRKLGYA